MAASGRTIIGVIVIRADSHIALLFVDKPYQRKGIARELVIRGIDACRRRTPNLKKITVNASPNAVAAYERIGFQCLDEEKTINGIRFVPMEFSVMPATMG